MSVSNRFTIEIYGLTQFTCLSDMCHGFITMEDSEDGRWRQTRERVQKYRRWLLLNKGVEDNRITVKENDSHVST